MAAVNLADIIGAEYDEDRGDPERIALFELVEAWSHEKRLRVTEKCDGFFAYDMDGEQLDALIIWLASRRIEMHMHNGTAPPASPRPEGSWLHKTAAFVSSHDDGTATRLTLETWEPRPKPTVVSP